MKSGSSSLNPYAEAYIPLSRRVVPDKNKGYEATAKDFKNGNPAFWMGSHPGDTLQYQYQKSPHQIYEDPKLKGQNIAVSYGSSSQNSYEITGKQNVDEDYDMDLAYLQMTFPGVSEQSLFEVYIANKGDLESAVDMLNQLEVQLVNYYMLD